MSNFKSRFNDLIRRIPLMLKLYPEPNGQPTVKLNLPSGTSGTFMARIIAIGLGLLSSLILARLMGASDFGIYKYALSWIALLGIMAIFGMDTYLVREVARNCASAEWGGMRGLIVRSNQLALFISFVVIALAVGVSWRFRNVLDPDFLRAFWIALALLPFLTLVVLQRATLRALNHPALGQFLEMAFIPTLFLASIGIFHVFNSGSLLPQTTLTLRVAAAITVFLLGLWLVGQRLPREAKIAHPTFKMRTLIRGALPFLLISSFRVINNQTDIIMIGMIEGTRPVGVYAIAAQGASLVMFIMTAVSVVLQPLAARFHAESKMDQLQHAVTRFTRTVFVLSIPVALGFIVFGDWFLMLFGEDFSQGKLPLAILSCAQLVNVFSGMVGVILTMTGNERDVIFGIGIGALLNIILNAILIPLLSITGAAIATGISLIAWNVLLVFRIHVKLGIDPTAFGSSWFRPGKSK
jgi:O-antigen/teichoic acid export membrane protein